MADSTYTPSSPLVDGAWNWRVRARDANGTESGWAASSFELDTVAPYVASSSPGADAENISTTTSFQLLFSETINPEVSPELDFLPEIEGDIGELAWSSDTEPDNTLTFTPANPLERGTNYLISLSLAEDPAGNAMEEFELGFATIPATTVSSTTPASDSVDVPLDTDIRVVYSRSMDIGSDPTMEFTPAIAETDLAPAWSTTIVTGDTAIFSLPDPLEGGPTLYSVTLSGGLDLEGDPGPTHVFSFTTEDTTAPTVASTSPADGAIAVLLDASVSVVFSETMDSTVDPTLSFNPAYSGTVEAPVWSQDDLPDDTATFTLTGQFPKLKGYTATLTDAQDPAGNVMEDYSFIFTTGELKFPLTLTPAGTGAGTVTSAPDGIDCGLTCLANFDSGTSVTLTAVPAASSTFDPATDWSGCDSVSGGLCMVAMSAAKSVTATFTIKSYALTITKPSNGRVTSDVGGINCGLYNSVDYPACTATIVHGTDVTLTAAADTNYHLANWIGDCAGGAGTCAVNNITLAKIVGATFAIDTFDITASAGADGSITPSGAVSVDYDGSQTFTIAATTTGYHIADVLVDGGSVGAVGSYTFNNVTAAHTISATFAIDTFTIAASAGANGSITPSGNVTVNYDGSQTFAITATTTGYHIADVLVDGGPVGAVSSHTFNNVTAGHTIAASFAIDTFDLTVTGPVNGSVTSNVGGIDCPGVLCTATYDYNTLVTLTESPDAGYSFSSWGGACSGSGGCSVTMTAAETVTATFEVASPTDVGIYTGTTNTISWTDNPAATSHNIYWGATPGVTKAGGAQLLGVTSPYVHPGCAIGSKCYYVVTAVKGAEESAESAEVSGSPIPLDTTFGGDINPADGTPDGFVIDHGAAGGDGADYGQAVAIDGSGRILVAGYSHNGTDNDMALWRYNADGTLDTTFSGDGIVTHNGAAGGTGHDQGMAVAIDGSGRILVAGFSTSAANGRDMTVWRYTDAGVLDTSFNTTGYATHNNAAGGNNSDGGRALAIDSSGRIVVVGYSTNAGYYDMAVWRYTEAGALDTTFNTTGFVTHNGAAGGNAYDWGQAVAIDSSGRIVVAGVGLNGSSNYDMVLWRYTEAGALDNSFSANGIVSNGAIDQGEAVAIDSLGRILVTGGSQGDMVLMRYTEAGVLDTSFDTDGIVTHDNAAGGNGNDHGDALTIDGSGRIVVAGRSRNNSADEDLVLWRFTDTGTLDTTFDGDGFLVHNSAAGGNSYDYVEAVAIDGIGRILVVGYSNNGTDNDMALWRFNPDGTPTDQPTGILDDTFGGDVNPNDGTPDGFVIDGEAAGGTSHDYGYATAVDGSGRILVAGDSINAAGNADMALWRYNADGTLDATFGGGDGIVTHNSAAGGNSRDHGYAVAIDGSGRILVAGSSFGSTSDDLALWRYNADGTLDSTFGGGDGIVTHHDAAAGDSDDFGRAVAVDGSGRIVVAGWSWSANGTNDMALWRFTEAGVLDTSFSTDGIVTHHGAAGGAGQDFGQAVAIDGSGRILVAGSSFNGANDDMALWRYTDAGVLDASFSGNGIVTHNSAAGGTHDLGEAMVIDGSGRILVIGSSYNGANYDMALWRYTEVGALDTNFDTDGFLTHAGAAGGNGNDYGDAVAIDGTGRIVVAGYSINAAGNFDMTIWRYTDAGALDTSFDTDGIVTHDSAAGGGTRMIMAIPWPSTAPGGLW